MASVKGRPRDPKRAARRTGHRRKPDEAPRLAVVPAVPGPDVALPPPADLPEKMVSTWERVVELLPVSRREDALGIEALVRQYHRMREAGELVDQYGVVFKAESGAVIASPFVKAERDATAMFLRLAEQFGLTVASRMRLGLMQLQGVTMAEALQRDLAED